MEIIGVRDVAALYARFEECFAGENHDRPLIVVEAPKRKDIALPPGPATVKERWYAFDWRLDCAEIQIHNTHYAGEAFPRTSCNLGPDQLTAYLGSELEFAPDTSWAAPRVMDWAAEPPLKFNPANRYWKNMERFLKLSCQRGRNKWMTITGDLHANADALSALRGPENLCLDLIEQPAEIHKRLKEVFVAWKEVVDRTCAIICPETGGYATNMNVLVKGKYVTLQNDFCCMVGPEMFREFFQKPLQAESDYLARRIYHWDGPGALPHQDALCEIANLEMLQWVPGAGQPPMSKWLDLLRQVQARGKGLYVDCGDKNEVFPVAEALKPEKVIITCDAESPEEADAVVKKVEEICRHKRNRPVSM